MMATEPKMSDRTKPPVVTDVIRPVRYPMIVTPASESCNCHTGSGFEQKIKENPMLFVLGALVVGYLLAKNH